MTTAATDDQALDHLLVVLDGLVPLHIARLTQPDEMVRAHEEAGDLADRVSEAGDRLTAPGNFRSPDDRQTRGRLLAAMATCLAIGAHEPGGITWAGAHWCAAPHPDCPHSGRTQ